MISSLKGIEFIVKVLDDKFIAITTVNQGACKFLINISRFV